MATEAAGTPTRNITPPSTEPAASAVPVTAVAK
jgi:hypothetical protein